ncbi:anhydro-N-acetylmuramic acid kinase [Gilvimarinus sp. DA14]|uniref:anhydro-N-acetylmuramic acid kinase n=1 Tax=Gilvimarinus sp. DA14 TaxID=2956798 RepID=UPI0020B6DA77|nr:anhydro-N-acetylmuramic acid kinase [Gilvimarinus sp. DA14]UTF59400.1 anhydro-N-acetylmuramic acid kinase [Gilvimarinus sp. DA14]
MSLYIGLISGTSADGIDAALVDINEHHCDLKAHLCYEFSPALRQRIHALCSPGDNEIELAGALDRELGELFANATKQLLERANTPAEAITAIGSHGQTIRHRPPGQSSTPFSWQIGDPNIIAERSGITTVADLRRRDMAAGGQGAPLVPAFHQHVFSSPTTARAIINIGGISNISWLAPNTPVLGFDTGPGNTLLDAWILQESGQAFDKNGAWAASGTVDSQLLQGLLGHPYLQRPIPKSSGREEFNLAWLAGILNDYSNLPAADIQATLLEFTAVSVSEHLQQCPGADAGGEIYICGGGAHNSPLLNRLARLNPAFKLDTTEALGIAPDWVEAAAFAWLAHRALAGLPGNQKSVTGAAREVVLGGVYPAAPKQE